MLLVLSLLSIFTLSALGTIKEQSPTIDEPVHLLAGYSYLKWRDYRVNPEHPPLAKMLAALPLLGFNVNDPRPSAPEWEQITQQAPGIPTAKVATEMFFVRNDAETLFFYAKLPFVILGLILGLAVFVWANQFFGFVAALAALVLFSTNPNIIAHSTIVHTDIAFTVFFFIGTYFFQRTLRSQSWVDGLITCIVFALAAITKFSAVAIFISWTVIGFFWIMKVGSDNANGAISKQKKSIFLASILACMVAVAFAFIWAAYGFRFAATPEAGSHWTYAHVMPRHPSALVQGAVGFVTRFHLFPDAWIYGQLYNLTYLRRTAFLLGNISDDGFWLYFPIAVITKMPVPALVLIAAGIVSLCTIRQRSKFDVYVLTIPVLVYFSLAVYARMNIGVRHILPIFPFLFVIAGAGASRLWNARARWIKGALACLALWSFWNVAAVYPNYLSFFNEIVGGPKNGHKILLDSNLDWGQDLKGLKTWLDKRGTKKVLLLYFGLAEPAYYGIDAVPFPAGLFPPRLSLAGNPELPYTLAVSANHLYVGRFLTDAERAFLQSFHLKEPDAVIGQSVLIFNLDPSDPQVNLSLGTIMALHGEWELAEQSLRKVLSSPRYSPGARKILAQVLARQGKIPQTPDPHDPTRVMQRSSYDNPSFANQTD